MFTYLLTKAFRSGIQGYSFILPALNVLNGGHLADEALYVIVRIKGALHGLSKPFDCPGLEVLYWDCPKRFVLD